MQKPSIKYYQTKSSNTLTGSYTMIKWVLSHACKESSIFASGAKIQSLIWWSDSKLRKKHDHLNRFRGKKKKTHTTVDKIQIPFMSKNSPESGHRENLPQQVLCLVAPSCLTLCNPVDCSPPGSSVHGDSPGKNIGVGCHAFLQGSSLPRDRTQVSCTAGRFFTIWVTREASKGHI